METFTDETVMQQGMQQKVTKEQLFADLKTVVSDAEALLRATANQGGEELAALRTRAEDSIRAVKGKLADEQEAVMALSQDAVKAADVYVRLYPWTAVGVAAGVGLLVGLLSHHRQ